MWGKNSANVTDANAISVHGTNPQNLIEKILRSKIYNHRYWKEHCFGLTAESLVDKAMELEAETCQAGRDGPWAAVRGASARLCGVGGRLRGRPGRAECAAGQTQAGDGNATRMVRHMLS